MKHLFLTNVYIFEAVTLSVVGVITEDAGRTSNVIHGRYTRNIEDYELVIPIKEDHEGAFVSHKLPHFYERDKTRRKKRMSPDDKDKVHIGLSFNGKHHHMEMWPNHDFLSPGAMVEERDSGSAKDVKKIKIRPVKDTQCHYTGRVQDHDNSRLAISVCDGLAGYIKTDDGHYFIEPVEDQQPETNGKHLHVVYKRSAVMRGERNCASQSWKDGWRDRLEMEYRRRRVAEIYAKENGLAEQDIRRTFSKHRYQEILVVADKRFLQFHNNTDYEMYILTIMNMASDYYHDASAGNLIDFVVVRIMYLHKEEEEVDLIISQDAEPTLSSFCKWQTTINPPDLSHPNHHDIAVLLTRYDICIDNMTECGLLGLAYVAQACNPNKTCAICEDTGLLLGVTVTHEVGHVMGCGHDDEVDSDCKPFADDVNAHVMSPYVQMATANWSICSKRFMQEFLDNDLGDCLLDEPQDHNFNIPEMPPGAMYDANFQCAQEFRNPEAKYCDMGPETNCKFLNCEFKPNTCGTYNQPPADGTKCGTNMWCYDRKCVPMGQRPEAVNGGWSAWSKWSDCSRTCGGGIKFMDRDCTAPTPQNHGRYCLGERREYRVCNTRPCDPESPTFREQQCAEYNTKPREGALHKWSSYVISNPAKSCTLICVNEENAVATLAQRAKDGTRCKPGTKDMCVAGLCRHVGCDWKLGSDAVEDRCGICRGDGTQCTAIEKVFKGKGKGYVKIHTFPKGSRRITVKELRPTSNTLALGPEKKKVYYLNGDYTEENDRELHIVGTIGYYYHPEDEREEIVIAGPTKDNLVLYACFYGDRNPGIEYKYSLRLGNESEAYQPSYHWEFVDWGECSKRCGGGVQQSEPKCLEARDGTVSNSFCSSSDKPTPKSRPCNENPCHARWRVGEWSECNGCLFRSGYRSRTIDCIMESPTEDQEIITEDSDCKETKPNRRELCTSTQPCKPEEKTDNKQSNEIRRRIIDANGSPPHNKQKNAILHENNNLHKDDECDTDTTEKGVEVGSVVKDVVPPYMFHLVEIPMQETKTEIPMSDEAIEALGDVIPKSINVKKAKVYFGDAAQREKEEGKKQLQKKKDKDVEN
ncbi:A disintegrin and metalloproteinase with thrombospondin motifs 12-like [Periplaneta americana]|uniref:A disintegrin and metalloproteinase with thrombospondin motifs 12-like n=1 Tax=Periplaneta americana TaxID=6978 RepID=UPI0037E983C1